MKRRFLTCMGSLALLALTRCSPASSPEAGDTNTSWLRSCSQDGECAGDARCLAQICSLACSAERASSCTRVAAAAICEQASATQPARCDLPCVSDQACTALGARFVCANGRCREAGDGASGDEDASPLDAGSEPPTDAEADAQMEVGPKPFALITDRPDVNAGNPLALDGWVSSAPTASWGNDRWRVAFRSAPPDAGTNSAYAFHTRDIYPDGTMSDLQTMRQSSADPSLSFDRQAVGGDGSAAELLTPGHGRSFTQLYAGQLNFYLPAEASVHTLAFQAPEMILDFAPIAQSPDWLILALASGEAGLGRYRPGEDRWIAEPQPIFSGFGLLQSIDLGVSGSDAFVRWAHDTSLSWATAPSAASATPTALMPLSPWTSITLTGDTVETQFDDRFAYLHTGDQTWQVYRVADTTQSEPVAHYELTQDDLLPDPPFTIYPQASAQVASADAGLIGVCYAGYRLHGDVGSNEGALYFSLFAADGTRRTGPIMLGEDDNMINGCDLTWSGGAFLALWAQGGADRWSIHARIIPMP